MITEAESMVKEGLEGFQKFSYSIIVQGSKNSDNLKNAQSYRGCGTTEGKTGRVSSCFYLQIVFSLEEAARLLSYKTQ